MIQTIPYTFNKMAVYSNIGGSQPPVPPVPSGDPNLIWYMDFSNGLYQSYSQITGINQLPNDILISSSVQIGYYLQCNKGRGDDSNKYLGVYWPGSETYLNNILTNSTDPFSISFWLRSPYWGQGQNTLISWRYDDNETGLVIFRDGSNDELDARLSYVNNFFSNTYGNVNNNWNHWVFVRDSSGGYWYYNGSLDAENDWYQNQSCTATDDIRIAGTYQWWDSQGHFDVTKIRIYNRALTSNEIFALYVNKQ